MFIKRDKFKIKIYYCKGYYDDIFVGEMILNSEQFQKISEIVNKTKSKYIFIGITIVTIARKKRLNCRFILILILKSSWNQV